MTNFSEHEFIAHVYKNDEGEIIPHYLKDHLQKVAEMAADFARPFGGERSAYLAGLWHDLGKYSNDFQQRIKKANAIDINAHIELEGDLSKDHSTAGAIWSYYRLYETHKKEFPDFQTYEKILRRIGKNNLLSYIIAGHHAGLSDRDKLEDRLRDNMKLLDKVLKNETHIDIDALRSETTNEQILSNREDIDLYIRLLFSCLVDADFLDTENFYNSTKSQTRKINFNWNDLLETFNNRLKEKFKNIDNTSELNEIRMNILSRCREIGKMNLDQKIVQLAVPTGGGKTISSMAFALEQAKKFNKSRIIYVIPFISIIEQNAEVFRNLLGDKYILEHHANFEITDEKSENCHVRLATENWDYPIVITTAVQFLESLFHNRTSKVRKLHNIVNSIIILDEVHLLPSKYLKPILRYFKYLCKNYGVVFVLCSATQPNFFKVVKKFSGLSECERIDILDDPVNVFEKLQSRVKLKFLGDIYTNPDDWSLILEEISIRQQALIIVNTKKTARDLYTKIKEQNSQKNIYHLSTNMCAEHRLLVIKEIKQHLDKDESCIVISTQLIEAGVDLDFPVVYRALAGLDSIAQSAGRCNREGKMPEGQVFIFRPPLEYDKLQGDLKNARDAGQYILKEEFGEKALCLEAYEKYFERLWHIIKEEQLDAKGIEEKLKELDFQTVAKDFKIIEENGEMLSVLVPFGNGKEHIEKLENNEFFPNHKFRRRLNRYIVNMPAKEIRRLMSEGVIKTHYLAKDLAWIGGNGINLAYDEHLGLVSTGSYDPNDMIF